MPGPNSPVPVDQIAHAIHVIRGHRVMLDADLATLYGVTTKRLNQQLRRNRGRSPPRLCIPTDSRGGPGFKVANCDLKRRPSDRGFEVPRWHLKPPRAGWSPLPAVRLHRARRRDARQRPQQSSRRRSQHSGRAGVRPAPEYAGGPRRPGPQAGRTGAEVRLAVPSGVRRDPPADGAATGAQAHRVPGPPGS